MVHNNRTCSVCNKQYHVCIVCDDGFGWENDVCSEECAKKSGRYHEPRSIKLGGDEE